MIGPVARILIRYGTGALVAAALIDPGTAFDLANDRDLAMIVEVSLAALPGLATEAWYWAAKRYGWSV